jgi:1-phosphofructokinase
MIVTVTLNPAVDHTLQVDLMPERGTVERTDSVEFDAGGKGINVSQYLVGLDTESVATGLVGDFLGEYVRNELADEGVPSDFVDIDGRTRLNTTILAPDGEYKVNHEGPSVGEGVVYDVIDAARRHDPEFVHVGGSLPPGLDAEAVDRIARAGDWDAVADVGGATLQELDAEYALCKPNRTELAAATGMPVDSVEDCLRAAAAFRERGFDRVVASLGSDGAVLASDEELLHAAPLDVDVADTVGAGDALLSGVLSVLVAGGDVRTALKRGVAVASRVVALRGTRVPDVTDLDAAADSVSLSEYPSLR